MCVSSRLPLFLLGKAVLCSEIPSFLLLLVLKQSLKMEHGECRNLTGLGSIYRGWVTMAREAETLASAVGPL